MNAFLSRDHHTKQRQTAIAALSGKTDSEDRSSMTVAAGGILISLVCAIVAALWGVVVL